MEPNLNKGQHFLIDSKIIEKEIEVAQLSKRDKVIEIGAGEGNLTSELVKKAGEVIAFEVDKRYSEELDALKQNNSNLKVIYDDALEHSWKGSKIVANIPYFISEQVITKCIEEGIQEMVLIVGEKFKGKLEENESKVGIISNLFYNVEFIEKVGRECFSPVPRVDSWMIKFERKKKFSKAEELLIYILRGEGKLKNSILHALVNSGKTKNQARDIIAGMGLYKNVLEKPIGSITGKILLKLKEEFEKD